MGVEAAIENCIADDVFQGLATVEVGQPDGAAMRWVVLGSERDRNVRKYIVADNRGIMRNSHWGIQDGIQYCIHEGDTQECSANDERFSESAPYYVKLPRGTKREMQER